MAKRKTYRRRRTTTRRRRNPGLSAATKRKISLALKRRNSSKKTSPAQRKTSKPKVKTRTRTKVVTKYRARRPASRRRSSLAARARRSVGKLNLKDVFNKDVLKMAGGSVGAALMTNYVYAQFGNNLPMGYTTIGQIGYRLLIPFAGAYATRRFDRKVSDGMLIGGVILAINKGIELISNTGILPTSVTGTGEYFTQDQVGEIPDGSSPGYNAINSFGAPSVYESQGAFADTAWG